MIRGRELWRAVKLNKSTIRDVFLLPDYEKGRPVVVKRYPIEADALREYEVLTLGQENPRLPSVYEYYEKEGQWYIVMEYIPGKTLAQHLDEIGPMEPSKVVDLCIDILKGLDALHGLGYVHGDLHANNIIVTDLDHARTKIIDFQHSVKKLSSGKAKAIRVVPKPHLMLAPESTTGVIDDRYDLYGVGYMAACMLAGVKLDRPLKENDLSPNAHALDDFVRKAMHKNPRKRHGSAQEMIVALSQWQKQPATTGASLPNHLFDTFSR